MDRLPLATEEDVMDRCAEGIAADRKAVRAAAGMLVGLEQTNRMPARASSEPTVRPAIPEPMTTKS